MGNYIISEAFDKLEKLDKLNKKASHRNLSEAFHADANSVMTTEQAKQYWEENCDSDPVLCEYDSFDEWCKDSVENGYIVDEDELIKTEQGEYDTYDDDEFIDEEIPELEGEWINVEDILTPENYIQKSTFTEDVDREIDWEPRPMSDEEFELYYDEWR